MKVVIFGATGFVGSATLQACVSDPSITEIVAVSRREIQDSLAQQDKVKVVLHKDFLSWPLKVTNQLSNSRACFWCIGGRHTQTSRWPTHGEYVRDSVDITLAAAKAMIKDVVPKLQEKPFRFVFCSGDSTELDPDKRLWILETTRKIKGQAENGLYKLADEHLGEFEAYSVRPCGIYQPKPRVKDWLLTTFVLPSLRVEALAATIVEVGKIGFEKRIIDHKTAKEYGEHLLNPSKNEGN